MTVQATASRVTYAGDGSSVVFSIPFKFLANEDIRAVYLPSGGSETVWALDTDFTLTGAGSDSGGELTATTAPAVGSKLTILRSLALSQETDYVENDNFPAETHEAALDRGVMISQQLSERLDRALVLPESSTLANISVPEPEDGALLSWDGSTLSNTAVVTLDGVAVPLTVADNAIVRFDGTTGRVLQSSDLLVTDDGDIVSGGNTITLPGSSGTLPLASDIPANPASLSAEQAWTRSQYFTPQTVSSSSGALTIDFSSGGNVVFCTLTENITSITLSGTDNGGTYRIHFLQAAGLYTVNGWPGAVKWAGGEVYSSTATNGAYDTIVLDAINSVLLGSVVAGHA
jgi:hypothetical protein